MMVYCLLHENPKDGTKSEQKWDHVAFSFLLYCWSRWRLAWWLLVIYFRFFCVFFLTLWFLWSFVLVDGWCVLVEAEYDAEIGVVGWCGVITQINLVIIYRRSLMKLMLETFGVHLLEDTWYSSSSPLIQEMVGLPAACICFLAMFMNHNCTIMWKSICELFELPVMNMPAMNIRAFWVTWNEYAFV